MLKKAAIIAAFAGLFLSACSSHKACDAYGKYGRAGVSKPIKNRV